MKQTIPFANLISRLWIYQAERFPLFAHGSLIFAFSFSAVSFSALLRGAHALPRPDTILVAFLSAFLFFLQLRIADEFKDFAEDARYRPYRPVPRGLVTLRELAILGALTLGLQLSLALWLEPLLAWLLLAVWGYLASMSREFFVREWLRARPFTYLWTHLLIVPLIDLYTTACDWLAAGEALPHTALAWFLIVSFFNGAVIELGRKIRPPEDEQPGVETYSALWGGSTATLTWLGALGLAALSAWQAARAIDFAGPLLWLLAALLALAVLVAIGFLQKPNRQRARLIETMSGLWTILMYLGIGAGPLVWRILNAA